jgi:hypothetical protein
MPLHLLRESKEASRTPSWFDELATALEQALVIAATHDSFV